VTKLLTNSHYGTENDKCQDGALWREVHEIFADYQRTVFARELNAIFNNLHDGELLKALERTRWTGRPGYPIKVMWRSTIASYVLNIPTIQELIRILHRNPFIAMQCGIYYKEEIPTRFCYYRFAKKLIAYHDLIEECMAKTVGALVELLPRFGEIIAIDSTDIPTYARQYKKPPSDHDAGWGIKADKDGRRYTWLGYKLHIVADASYEVPLSQIITPANVNDSIMFKPLLQKNKSPTRIALADGGYDSKENYRAAVEDFAVIPIIDINLRNLKGKQSRFKDIADERWLPHCAWGIPMIFWGYDKQQKVLKYRCPRSCGKKGCTWLEKCSESGYGHVVKVKLKDDYRRFIQIPRHTKRFKQLYYMRVAVERVFSRLKKDGDGKVINHRLRGIDKITLNCLLSVWVMQARAFLA